MVGYGWVGRGIASRFRGMGAQVAIMRGRPDPRDRGAHGRVRGHADVGGRAWGEVFITATGNINVFRRSTSRIMRDGAILANGGHFDAEIELPRFAGWPTAASARSATMSRSTTSATARIHLIVEGRLVNLGAAEGHPAAVMDMSFANQALGAEYVARTTPS